MVGTPSIAELARDYQLAKMDGHLEVLALDSKAKVYKKVSKVMSGRGHTPRKLLAKSRTWQRQSWARQCMAFYQKHKGCSQIELAQLLCNDILTTQQVSRAVQMAKSFARWQRLHERNALLEDEKVIAQFEASIGKDMVGELFQRLPFLAATSLQAVACPNMQLFQVQTSGVGAKAAQACGWLSGNPQCNVGAGLDKFWKEAHYTTALPNHMPSADKDVLVRSACQQNGFCVCEGVGLTWRKLKNRLSQRLKHVFHSKAEKTLLAD
eukprot:1938607-Amphidinium_carterae.1